MILNGLCCCFVPFHAGWVEGMLLAGDTGQVSVSWTPRRALRHLCPSSSPGTPEVSPQGPDPHRWGCWGQGVEGGSGHEDGPLHIPKPTALGTGRRRRPVPTGRGAAGAGLGVSLKSPLPPCSFLAA